MFTDGFLKTSAILPALQTVRGTAARVADKTTKAVKGFVAGQKEKGIAAYRGAKRGTPRVAGETLYNTRAAKMMKDQRGPGSIGEMESHVQKAKQDVLSRAAKTKEYQKGKQKSFASKHPYITAGAMYLGARSAFGGGGEDKSQAQQPQYVAPQ